MDLMLDLNLFTLRVVAMKKAGKEVTEESLRGYLEQGEDKINQLSVNLICKLKNSLNKQKAWRVVIKALSQLT